MVKKILIVLGALLILGGFVPRDSYAQSFGRVEADLLRANGTAEIVAPEATAAVLRVYTDDGDDSGDKFSLNVSTADVFSIQNNGTAVVSVTTAGAVTTASTVSFLTTATVTGASSGNAGLILDADNSDDAPDKWTIQSTASGNALDVINDAATVLTLSTAGALTASAGVAGTTGAFSSTLTAITSGTVTGASSGDASVIIDADNSDDAADKWTLRSTASGNALDVINDTTAVVSVSTTGAVSAAELSLTGVIGTGKAVCVKSDGAMGVCGDAVGGSGTCSCS